MSANMGNTLITKTLPSKGAADAAFRNARANSNDANARIEHDKVLARQRMGSTARKATTGNKHGASATPTATDCRDLAAAGEVALESPMRSGNFRRERTVDDLASAHRIAVPQRLDAAIGAATELWNDDGGLRPLRTGTSTTAYSNDQ